jgi:hypothetical protein
MADTTNWMQETFTNVEKRDCALAMEKGLREQISDSAQAIIRAGHEDQIKPLLRQADLLHAIAADYDFKVRQASLPFDAA